MSHPARLLCLLGLLGAFACGDDTDPADGDESHEHDAGGDGDAGDGDTGDGDVGDGDTGDGDVGDGDASGPDPLMIGNPAPAFLQEVEDGWQVLLTGDWELDEGVEGYYCARFTLDRDIYFGATVPVSPLGTHHTLLSLEPEPNKPDGLERCDAGTNGPIMIAGSGVGTEAFSFPDGVAMRANKGSQMILNLHLYNPTGGRLEGRSGTLIKLMDEADVKHVAETTLAGPIDLDIPVGRVTEKGRCTFNTDVTVFGIGPHMHQTGAYLKAVAHSTVAGDVVLYDDDYDFEEQRIFPLEPIELKAGDWVDVECTYENDTGKTINFGDSSFAEMCFAGLGHYPSRNANSFLCIK